MIPIERQLDEMFPRYLDEEHKEFWSDLKIGRDDPFLIKTIEELGEKANEVRKLLNGLIRSLEKYC